MRGTTSKILYEWQIDNIRPSILLWLIVLQFFLSGTYIYSLFICSLQFILIQFIVYSNLEIKTMLVAVYFAYVILMERAWGLPQIIKLNATSKPVMKIMAYRKLSCAWRGGKRCSLSTALSEVAIYERAEDNKLLWRGLVPSLSHSSPYLISLAHVLSTVCCLNNQPQVWCTLAKNSFLVNDKLELLCTE